MLKRVYYWILFILYTLFVLFTDVIFDIIPKLLFPQGLAFRSDQSLPANYIPKVLTAQGFELLFYVQRIIILLFIIMYPLNYQYHSNDIIELTKKPYRRFIEIWTMMITGAITYHLILSRLARNFVDGKIIITLFDNRAYVIYEFNPSFPFLAVMDNVLNEAYFLIFDAAAFIIIISFLILNNSDSSENLLFPEIDPSDESLNEHIKIDSSKSQLFPSITNSFILAIVGILTYFLLNLDTLLIQQTIEQYAAMDTLNTYILINYIIIIRSIPDMIILLGGFYFVYNVIFTKFETFQYGLKSGIKFFIIRWGLLTIGTILLPLYLLLRHLIGSSYQYNSHLLNALLRPLHQILNGSVTINLGVFIINIFNLILIMIVPTVIYVLMHAHTELEKQR